MKTKGTMINLFKLLLTLLLFQANSIKVNAQTENEINKNAYNEFKKYDNALNNTYKEILNIYKDDSLFLKKLKIAQRAWLVFRDAHVQSLYPEDDMINYGSSQPVCYSNALSEITKERLKELNVWLEGTEEGDICSGSIKIKSEINRTGLNEKGILQLIFNLPEKIENWYADNNNNPDAEGIWKLCNLYDRPDSKAGIIGELWLKYEKKNVNFSICFKPSKTLNYLTWKKDIGDWGYGVREFIIEINNGFAKLPGKVFSTDAWIPVQKVDGLNGRVEPVTGELFYVPEIKATDLSNDKSIVLDNAVYLFLSKDEDGYIIRKEIPSDMPCGEDVVETKDKDKLKKYKIKIKDLFDKDGKVIISLAYPKGC
jgi:uncharacterized protein YecT (DUF1311 family)